jgi:hypothetical protein
MTGLNPDRQQARIDWMPGATAIDFAEIPAAALRLEKCTDRFIDDELALGFKKYYSGDVSLAKITAAVFGSIEG